MIFVQFVKTKEWGDDLFNINQTQSLCIYSQFYWQNIPFSKWPNSFRNLTLCNVSWYNLMKISTIKMAIIQNMYWMTSFHQLCTTMLNINQINQYNLNSSNSNGSINNLIYNITNKNPNVIRSISFFNDNLGSYCDSISSWGNDVNNDYIHQLQWILVQFNTGITGPRLCLDSYLINLNKSTSN